MYTCKAINALGIVSSSANLMVSTSEIREAPVFHEPLINVEVITGQPLHLECQGIIFEGRYLKIENSTIFFLFQFLVYQLLILRGSIITSQSC